MTDIQEHIPPPEAVNNSSVAAQIRAHVGLANEDEMAATLQVSHETLATWRTKKRGPPSIKLGKKVFYLIPDFSKWVMEEVARQHAPLLAASPRRFTPKPLPLPAAIGDEWQVT
jgi:hypothetical protein